MMIKFSLLLAILFSIYIEASPAIKLSPVEQYDLQMLNWGGFAPLTTFVGQKDYHCILEKNRLANGEIWPIPIVLTVDEKIKDQALKEGALILQDEDENILAVMQVKEAFRPDVEKEALAIYRSLDDNHPFISKILSRKAKWYVSGELDFRKSIPLPKEAIPPKKVRYMLADKKQSKVIGFQTRNPLHRCHFALTKRALSRTPDSILLLTPVIGPTQPGDIDADTRVKCYRAILPYYASDEIELCLIPLAMRMAGPKEALMHAIIRKNYGCTHFIIGRDHAGPSVRKKNGETFFAPYEAQEYTAGFADELGITLIKSDELVYVKEQQEYLPISSVPPSLSVKSISGTELRSRLKEGTEIPEWFSFPEVLEILGNYYQNRGICLYLVGLSGAGKTTLAQALIEPLEELTSKKVIFLDASVVRKTLFPELGFSKQERSENVQRTGKIAAMLIQTGAICIVANCAPENIDRIHNRELISQFGDYYEVFLDTPLEICVQRDPKNLYKKYFNNEIDHMIGLDLPYEKPDQPEFHLDGSKELNTLVEEILNGLRIRPKPTSFTSQ